MKVAIHQPNYIPWPGFFHKAITTDCMVLLDHVQYADKAWSNRNRIKTSQGIKWLSVPVLLPRYDTPMNTVLIDSSNKVWARKHFKTIYFNYKKAKYINDYLDFLEKVYNRDWEFMVDLNIEMIKSVFHILNIDTKLILSSGLDVSGSSNELLINICKKVGAQTFLSGSGGDYMQPEKFKAHDIDVVFQKFRYPTYQQINGKFMPNLSILDMLFNCGPSTRQIIESS